MPYTDDSENYCVRIIDLQKIITLNHTQYFLTIAGDAYGVKENFEDLGRAQSGLMGLFLFEIINNHWVFKALTKQFYLGNGGALKRRIIVFSALDLSDMLGWVKKQVVVQVAKVTCYGLCML